MIFIKVVTLLTTYQVGNTILNEATDPQISWKFYYNLCEEETEKFCKNVLTVPTSMLISVKMFQ